jgi:hypothetical protein
MSFSHLSVELDAQIPKDLHNDRQAPPAMSMASKHFRIVAKLILYRDLVFSEIPDA